jgi:hypothetical protein
MSLENEEENLGKGNKKKKKKKKKKSTWQGGVCGSKRV